MSTPTNLMVAANQLTSVLNLIPSQYLGYKEATILYLLKKHNIIGHALQPI